jgi:hypothetical protein
MGETPNQSLISFLTATVGIYCLLAALIQVWYFAFPTVRPVECSISTSDRNGITHILIGTGELYE